MENMRRDNISQIEQTYVRIRQEMVDLSNQMTQRANDRFDRLRDETDYRTRESDKVRTRPVHSALSPTRRTEPAGRDRATSTTTASDASEFRTASSHLEEYDERRTYANL